MNTKIIGQSPAMLALYDLIEKVAQSDATVLISGESGTGKELVARQIHAKSRRAPAPFMSVNCGALPTELLESILFGHRHGAFTGATSDHQGQLAACRGGTYLLDEVTGMSPVTQIKLLRALQEREIVPIGSNTIIQIDVRVIAATNADLRQEIKAGRFRTDLFYRLNVIPIVIPPLRDRSDDIPLLCEHFLARHPGKRLRDTAVKALMRYEWPGNVRELENVIERMAVLTDGREIQLSDVPEELRHERVAPTALADKILTASVEEVEREYILRVLEQKKWKRKDALDVLKIDAGTLSRKLMRWGKQSLVAEGGAT